MRCVVIDDEKPGLDLICSYISNIPYAEVAGAFSDISEALNYIISNPVDLLLSDIELNADINGLEFIRSLPKPPMVIFISAYDQFAIEGYSLDAVDYLLKPVSRERFSKAMIKAYEQWNLQTLKSARRDHVQMPQTREEQKSPGFIFIKTESKLVKVFFSEILFIKAFGDYVKIYLSGGRNILSLQTLNSFASSLPEQFIRIHRSYIVAIDKIDEIEKKRVRIGDEILPIGENYLDFFLEKVIH